MAAGKIASVLFVDDDETTVRALVRSLERRAPPWESLITHTAADALSILQAQHPEVAVVDLSLDPALGPESGLALVESIVAKDPTTRVLVLTGHGSEEYGIAALKRGASSFLVKPAAVEHLLPLIQDAINYSHLLRQVNRSRSEAYEFERLTGLSTLNELMRKTLQQVAYAAATNQPVLIVGETGTGKGVLAQAIHTASKRSGHFVRFQPSFCSGDLISSELFGHQKGAFTGAIDNRIGLIEEANRGSLFLDEVDELPLESQVMMLHVLQERAFRRLGSSKVIQSDFRLISATNRPLEESLAKHKLREDFYHRIAHLTIEVPPLRERIEDIPLLAQNFLRGLLARENLPVVNFRESALNKLQRYPFPGNVRELQAKVESAAYRAAFIGRRLIESEDLELDEKQSKQQRLAGLSFRERIQNYELQLIRESLAKHNNNQSRAAASLGIDRTTLRRVLERERDAATQISRVKPDRRRSIKRS